MFNKKILFMLDNMAVVYITFLGDIIYLSACSACLFSFSYSFCHMAFLSFLYYQQANIYIQNTWLGVYNNYFTKYNIHLRSQHIPMEITMKQLIIFHVSNSRKLSGQLHICAIIKQPYLSIFR